MARRVAPRYRVELDHDNPCPTTLLREDVTLGAARRYCRGKYGRRMCIIAADGTVIETWLNDHHEFVGVARCSRA